MMDNLLHDHAHGRRKVIGGLALAIILCSTSQVLWKYATQDMPSGATALQTLGITALRWQFWAAAALYIWQFFNWMMVLKHADLSFAQPIMAGTYVVVGAAAWFLFGENLPPHRILGILLILAGVIVISRSPHKTTAHEPELVVAGEVCP